MQETYGKRKNLLLHLNDRVLFQFNHHAFRNLERNGALIHLLHKTVQPCVCNHLVPALQGCDARLLLLLRLPLGRISITQNRTMIITNMNIGLARIC